MTLLPVRRVEADVAIVGSGFAGSMTALALRQLGRSVVLLDRSRHPRFAIGESSTPLAGLLIEELSDRYALPRLRPFSKWGTWQATYPEIGCGLKRGFSFFRHRPGRPFDDGPEHHSQLLVAASPNDTISDTHWYRPDFDHWLVREAESAGVVYFDEVELQSAAFHHGRATLEGTRHQGSIRIDAGFVVDASGPRGFLYRTLGLGDARLAWLPPTQALYTHFTDVELWESIAPPDAAPPFPVDAAAVHHVLDGGWIWVLRFNNGITSAGIAAEDRLAARLDLAAGAPAWDRVLDLAPSLRAQFARARAVRPFVYAPRIAHRTAACVGDGWALLPSAAGVIDPLLSTGFPLTLLGIGRLLEILAGTRPGPAREAALRSYERDTFDELIATERLVAALYATMNDFPLFKRLTALYFAAASFTETVRRLGRSDRARGFLLHADPLFGPAMRECTERAMHVVRSGAATEARAALMVDIDRAIAPFDVAGLRDTGRRDWYPVLAEDLRAAAPKLGATPAEIVALLARSGFDAGAEPVPRTAARAQAAGRTLAADS